MTDFSIFQKFGSKGTVTRYDDKFEELHFNDIYKSVQQTSAATGGHDTSFWAVETTVTKNDIPRYRRLPLVSDVGSMQYLAKACLIFNLYLDVLFVMI